jgi:hypothetical protein
MFNASSPATPGIGVGAPFSFWPSTSSRFDAGSVLTSSTRGPIGQGDGGGAGQRGLAHAALAGEEQKARCLHGSQLAATAAPMATNSATAGLRKAGCADQADRASSSRHPG